MFFLNIPKISQKTSKPKIWLYDRGDYDKFKQYLSDVDWYSLISSNNVNDRTTNITNVILYAAELCIPSKIITVRKNQPQWITSNIRKLIRKKKIEYIEKLVVPIVPQTGISSDE